MRRTLCSTYKTMHAHVVKELHCKVTVVNWMHKRALLHIADDRSNLCIRNGFLSSDYSTLATVPFSFYILMSYCNWNALFSTAVSHGEYFIGMSSFVFPFSLETEVSCDSFFSLMGWILILIIRWKQKKIQCKIDIFLKKKPYEDYLKGYIE